MWAQGKLRGGWLEVNWVWKVAHGGGMGPFKRTVLLLILPHDP